MLNLIKSDLYRIFLGKAIYITLAVIIVMGVIDVIGLSAGHIGIAVNTSAASEYLSDPELIAELSDANSLMKVREIMQKHGSFPLDKDILGVNVNLYYLFIVLVVIIITSDFSNKAIKNTLSSAVSKKTYYFSKLFLVLILGTIIILFNNYFNYFLNILVNGKAFSTPIWEFTKLSLMQLPLLYGIMSLLVCFAFVLKKTSLFNTIAIPFIMVLQLVVMGLTSLLKIKATWFYDYEVQFALEKLMMTTSTKYIITCLILGFVYIIIFNIIGYWNFRRAEIK